MTYAILDYYFPFVVFFYGVIMTMLLHSQRVTQFAERRLPQDVWASFASHRILGLVCLGVGMIWSLQNLWLSAPPA